MIVVVHSVLTNPYASVSGRGDGWGPEDPVGIDGAKIRTPGEGILAGNIRFGATT
jgi:hypothetical protein